MQKSFQRSILYPLHEWLGFVVRWIPRFIVLILYSSPVCPIVMDILDRLSIFKSAATAIRVDR